MDRAQEHRRQIPADIPPLSDIEFVHVAEEWPKLYGYPRDEECADYYVHYKHKVADFGGYALIEATKKQNIRKKVEQLRTSSRIFQSKGNRVDTHIIVLDDLAKPDQRLYKLEPGVAAPWKVLHRRQSYTQTIPELVNGKQILVIFRSDFHRLKK